MRRIKSAPANLAMMSNSKKNSVFPKKSLVPYFNNYYNSKTNYDRKNNFIDYIVNKKTYNNNKILCKNNGYQSNKPNKNYKNDKNDKYSKRNTYSNKKNLKNNINDATNIITDITVECNHYSLEEMSFTYAVLAYLNNNILKKDKFKALNDFIIKALIRYHILLFVHIYILHDKTDNVAKIVNAVDIEQVSNVVHMLPFNS